MKPGRAAAFADVALADGCGRRKLATMRSLDERDALLIEIARRFYPGLISKREIGRRLRSALLRYQSGRWRRDRACEVCPRGHVGTITALLWCLLRVRDHVPSEMTIRRALAFRDPRDVIRSDHRDDDGGEQ